MCGIAGYFGTRTIDSSKLEACLRRMHHRGPDSGAVEHHVTASGRNAYLLFRRLSIIDLDPRSDQPFHVRSKSIIFNGELYNYIERRAELERVGEPFTTTSDTEVMVRGIDRFGWEVLDRCEGMWAFALFDDAGGSLTLCRDRFGEKPLYLFRDASGIYFASEIKFLFELLGRRLPVNFQHLYRYLVNGYRALYKSGDTFFEGVSELPRATTLRIDASGDETLRAYWSPRPSEEPSMTYEEAVAGAREKLIRAVEVRLRADVPLAFCMSGGIDSNSLISIAKKQFGYDVHAFTIVNTDARYEEQEMVQCVVSEFGLRHMPIPTNPEQFLPRLRALVRHHDAPVYTISYYAHWLLMQSIHEHGYRISVSGTAADELFTGYYDHHLAYLYELRNDPDAFEEARRNWEAHVRPVVLNPHLRDPELFVRNPCFRDHLYMDAPAFAEYLREPWHEAFRETSYSPSLLRNRMLNELFEESIPVILHEDDLNAMSFSIENRSPFLDRELFEHCYRIPSRHLIRNGLAKAVLRDAVAGFLPERVRLNPRKVGFNAPIFSFLDVRDPVVREEIFAPSPIWDHIRRDKIQDILGRPDLPNSESKFVFNFLNAKMFLEELSGS